MQEQSMSIIFPPKGGDSREAQKMASSFGIAREGIVMMGDAEIVAGLIADFLSCIE